MTIVNPLTELAILVVENDYLRGQMDDQNLRSARESARRAVAEEVHAMREAADAIRTQAWVQGGMAAVGGAIQSASSLGQIGFMNDDTASKEARLPWEALGRSGGGLGAIAEPAGQLTGGTAKAEADADAREARGDAEEASLRADEARQHRERVERHTESVLSMVEGTLESEHQTNLAILGNF